MTGRLEPPWSAALSTKMRRMAEVELKFQLLPERRRALEQALRAGRDVRRMHLRALYFDTPRCDLAAAGLALRRRREGRVSVQAVKGAGDGPISRLEHEVKRGLRRRHPPSISPCTRARRRGRR